MSAGAPTANAINRRTLGTKVRTVKNTAAPPKPITRAARHRGTGRTLDTTGVRARLDIRTINAACAAAASTGGDACRAPTAGTRSGRSHGQNRWIKIEFALLLAETTGRRLGSIQALEWEDIDLQQGCIYWKADADKRNNDWIIPLPSRLYDEIPAFQLQLGTSGPIFTGERGPLRLMNRRMFLFWLHVAEEKADLRPLPLGAWHPYRREWATERKHLPLVDVAAAGGWKGTRMLLKCYQQPDPDTILAVMNEPSKLGEQWENRYRPRADITRPQRAPECSKPEHSLCKSQILKELQTGAAGFEPAISRLTVFLLSTPKPAKDRTCWRMRASVLWLRSQHDGKCRD